VKYGVETEHKHAYMPGMKCCFEADNYKHGSGTKLKGCIRQCNTRRIRS